jgi:acyl dehydratase
MKKYWDLIEIGDSLPITERPPISRLQIAQFAAATDEFSPLNLDDELAKNAGFNGVYAPGLMTLGFIEEALKAFASNMRILSLSGTFQRLIWPGDVLSSKGLVLRRYQKHNEHRIFFSLWCENQNNEIVMRGSAICLLFKNADQEQKSKKFCPVITTATHESLLNKCSHLLTKAGAKSQEKIPHRKEFA